MAAYAIQFRRGTTTQHNSFTGLLGEVTVDTDKKTLVVHDGSTTGGFPLAREGAASNASTGSFTSNVLVGGTLTVSATSEFNGDVAITGDLDMTGDIIPSANITYDLGSPTMMWKDIYVGPGSLYVNGKKVIEDNNGTINFTTDANETLKLVVPGETGTLQFSAGSLQLDGEINAITGDITFGDHLDMNSNRIKNVSSPVEGTDATNKTYVDAKISSELSGGSLAIEATTGDFSGDVSVAGSLTVTGTVTTVNSETIELADNILLLNSNAIGSATQNAGIEVERGDDLNVQLLWNETSNRWSLGNEDISASTFIGDLTGDVTGTVSSLSNHNTGDLAEGSNLYWTEARGTANFNTNLASANTGNVSEGTNLYFTDARAQAAVASDITDAQAAAEATASADATAKANTAEANAISAAQTDATSRANAAQAAAISAAATDATTKANAAQSAAATDATNKVATETTNRETAVTNAIATASADATTKANAAEADANTYTDGRETAITSAYTSAITTASNNSATDATTKADAAQAAAETYTDGRETAITTAYTAADTTLQSNIDTEKGRIDAIMSASTSDADTFAEIVSLVNSVDTTNDSALSGEIAARTSADTALSGRLDVVEGGSTVAGSVAKAQADAEATASADATAKADQALVDAKAYADTAEADAIASAEAKDVARATAANAYADQAEADAIAAAEAKDVVRAAAAEADATAKADAAQAAAEATASADATTKADAAQAAAEATASADATTKADAAQAAAEATAEAYTDTRETAITTAYTSAISTAVAGKDNTDEITEGTANLYFTDARARSAISVSGDLTYNATTGVISTQGLASSDTDDLAEGTTNLYFTDARAQASAKSAFTAGGDLSYADGEFSFTERTDAEVRGLISAGGDLSYDSTSGEFTVTTYKSADFNTDFAAKDTGDLAEGSNLFYTDARVDARLSSGSLASITTTGNASLGGNVTIAGDLTVSGTTTTVNSETVNLADNIILLNSNATGSATQNGGLEIERGDDINVQMIWDETNDRWSFVSKDVYTGGAFVGNLTGDVTGTVSSLSNHDTDDLAEGVNQYFTVERAQDAVMSNVTAGTGISVSYDDSIGELVITNDQIERVVDGLSFSNGVLTATRQNDVDLTVDLDGRYVLTGDDKYLVAHAFDTTTGILSSTVDNSSTVTVDLDGRYLVATDETFVNGLDFDTASGVLTVARQNDLDLTVDLDGRYLLAADFDAEDNHLTALAFDTVTGVLTATLADTSTIVVDLDGRYVDSVGAGAGLSNSGTELEAVLDVNVDRGLSIAVDKVGITDTGVTSGSYGSADTVATYTVNSRGQLTAAGSTAISIQAAAVTDFVTEARDAVSVSGDLSYVASTGVISFTERTDAEVRGLVSVSGDLSYVASTGVISFTERTDAEVRGLVSAGGDLSYNASTGEFTVTKYATADFNADFAAKDTGDLAEGSNQYFTNARAVAAVEASITHFHSAEQTVTAAVSTANATASVSYTFAELEGADHYAVYLNRQLLRPGEFTANANATNNLTISTGILAEDDELEVVGFKL